MDAALSKIGLGGGCHWCTEGIFVHLRGVTRVEQGWITSEQPHAAPSEAVIVHYDGHLISSRELIEVHLSTHAATKAHAMRAKYRSAVYYFDESAEEALRRNLDEAAATFAEPVLTLLLPFKEFTASLAEHRDYYRTDPDRPFCRRYIQPKLNRLKVERADLLREGTEGLSQ